MRNKSYVTNRTKRLKLKGEFQDITLCYSDLEIPICVLYPVAFISQICVCTLASASWKWTCIFRRVPMWRKFIVKTDSAKLAECIIQDARFINLKSLTYPFCIRFETGKILETCMPQLESLECRLIGFYPPKLPLKRLCVHDTGPLTFVLEKYILLEKLEINITHMSMKDMLNLTSLKLSLECVTLFVSDKEQIKDNTKERVLRNVWMLGQQIRTSSFSLRKICFRSQFASWLFEFNDCKIYWQMENEIKEDEASIFIYCVAFVFNNAHDANCVDNSFEDLKRIFA